MVKQRRTSKRSPNSKKRKTARVRKASIREEIRNLTLTMIQERKLKLNQLSQLSEDILSGSVEAIAKALPASRKSAMNQIINGMHDAWVITTKASVSALRHAKKKGIPLTKHDLANLKKNLYSIEASFINTLERSAKRLKGDVAQEFTSITAKLRKTGTELRPIIQNTLKYISEHGIEVVSEVASSGIKVGSSALRNLVLGTSDVLEGLAKSLSPSDSKGSKKPLRKKKALTKAN